MVNQTSSVVVSRDVVEEVRNNQNIAFFSLSGVPGVGKTHFTVYFEQSLDCVQVIPRVSAARPCAAQQCFWDSCRYGIRQKDFQSALLRPSPSVVHLHHDAVEGFRWAVNGVRGSDVKSVVSILLTCGDKDILRYRIAQKWREISEHELQKILSLQRKYEESGLYDLTIDTVNTTDAEFLDRVTSCIS